MRENNFSALDGYRTQCWSVGKPSVLIPKILQRQFTVTRPNNAWVTDITYIRTCQAWLYLAVIVNLFSCKIIGLSAGPNHSPRTHAQRRADSRTPLSAQHGYLCGQGAHYGSDAWRRFCRSNQLEPSMNRKGNCCDNAVDESFFSSLKKDPIKKQIYKNRELALADVADYIDVFYNPTHRHNHLGA